MNDVTLQLPYRFVEIVIFTMLKKYGNPMSYNQHMDIIDELQLRYEVLSEDMFDITPEGVKFVSSYTFTALLQDGSHFLIDLNQPWEYFVHHMNEFIDLALNEIKSDFEESLSLLNATFAFDFRNQTTNDNIWAIRRSMLSCDNFQTQIEGISRLSSFYKIVNDCEFEGNQFFENIFSIVYQCLCFLTETVENRIQNLDREVPPQIKEEYERSFRSIKNDLIRSSSELWNRFHKKVEISNPQFMEKFCHLTLVLKLANI